MNDNRQQNASSTCRRTWLVYIGFGDIMPLDPELPILESNMLLNDHYFTENSASTNHNNLVSILYLKLVCRIVELICKTVRYFHLFRAQALVRCNFSTMHANFATDELSLSLCPSEYKSYLSASSTTKARYGLPERFQHHKLD